MLSSSYMFAPTFNVDTPCYQSCWVAPTADRCFQELQKLPMQVSVAAALKKLVSTCLQEEILFKASDIGMHTIIIGA